VGKISVMFMSDMVVWWLVTLIINTINWAKWPACLYWWH